MPDSNAASLELKVQVYNINHGFNSELLERSKTLCNYCTFMEKIREYKRELTLEESIKAAVKYCIENEILKHFLECHASEVVNMLTDEISIERIIEIRVNEAVEDAVQAAREETSVIARKEAREEEKLEIARNLLAKGSTPEFVCEITGLSIEKIEKL